MSFKAHLVFSIILETLLIISGVYLYKLKGDLSYLIGAVVIGGMLTTFSLMRYKNK